MKYLIYIFLFSIIFFSCKKEEGNDKYINIKGQVMDLSWKGISDVIVRLPQFDKETRTDAHGNYEIQLLKENINEDTIVDFRYEKEGYFTLIQHFYIRTSTFNVRLRSFADEAYFSINPNQKQVPSTQGTFFVTIETNVYFEVENSNNWINFKISNDTILFNYNENEVLENRIATIKFKVENNLSNELKIIQSAGPILRVLDYIGKDNTTSFLTTIPFVTFNREIKLLNVKSSCGNINLSYQYSEDKKTILFPDVKIPALETVVISYTAMASDSVIAANSFELKAYESIINSDPTNGQKVVFTKDNNYFWLFTMVAQGASSLVQYSTKDLSVTNTIPWKDMVYSDFFYNAFDNTILIVQNKSRDENGLNPGKIDVFNAENGSFVKTLDLTSDLANYREISGIAFGSNGFGLMLGRIAGGGHTKLFYLNSADNYKCGLFSDDPMYYDPSHPDEILVKNISTCNNGRTLVLLDDYYVKNIFTVNIETNYVQRYLVSANYFLTNYSYSGIFVGQQYGHLGTYIDVNTGSIYNVNVNNPGRYAVFLQSENILPTILLSDLAMINLQSNEEKKFQCTSSVFPFTSSYDGKILVIGTNKKLMIFKSETFIKHFDKIE